MENTIEISGFSSEFWKYQDDVLRVAEDISNPETLMINCEEIDQKKGLKPGTTWQQFNALMSEQLKIARGPQGHR